MKLVTLIAIVFSTSCVFAQEDPPTCIKSNKLKPADIRKLFPYNQAASIRIVSFKREDPDSDERRKIPLKEGKVNPERMFESVTLNETLRVKLEDVLLNYISRPGVKYGEVYACYEPRNAILFFDKSENIIGYIELCFDCYGLKIEPGTIFLGMFCSTTYNEMKKIFIEAGITYGMKGNMQ
ncbi:MAG: hypothetical protein H7Y31_07985 [Chitinophagaceae bacterium]|nr:hypothetical protein [Chitinophagaceae bacterium]